MELLSTTSSHYTVLFSIALLAVGAVFGSFINAVAMRTVAGRKWWGNERSKCDHCGRELTAVELIPIVSYLIQGGKCRHCRKPIAGRHFAAELLCAVLTVTLFLRWGLSPAYAMALVTAWFGLFNSLTDLENGYIYDLCAVLPGILGLALRLFGGWPAILDGLLGAALGFGFIALIILVSRGGMGWGDAMLMLGIGAALGWRYCALSLYAGFLLGGVIVVPMLIAKKISRKDAVPLGPFLSAGAVTILFMGDFFVEKMARIFGGLYSGWPWM